MDHKIIYFLCTGNACRSQMAEGFAKEYLGEEWIVHSAGTYAHGINSHAVEAMKEIGIDISNHTSDIIDPDILHRATLVVTLCGAPLIAVRSFLPMLNMFIAVLTIPLGESGLSFNEFEMKSAHG